MHLFDRASEGADRGQTVEVGKGNENGQLVHGAKLLHRGISMLHTAQVLAHEWVFWAAPASSTEM